MEAYWRAHLFAEKLSVRGRVMAHPETGHPTGTVALYLGWKDEPSEVLISGTGTAIREILFACLDELDVHERMLISLQSPATQEPWGDEDRKEHPSEEDVPY